MTPPRRRAGRYPANKQLNSDMEQKNSIHCSVKGSEGSAKIAIFLVLAVVILAVGVGIFYYKFYLPKTVGGNSELGGERSEPPKLFSKGDYKVEERTDGKYIVVDKVGLTAKVPDGWRVEFEGEDNPDGTSQHWG